MRKLSNFLGLMPLFSIPVFVQENKISVKKSGNGHMPEANGKNFFNTTIINHMLLLT